MSGGRLASLHSRRPLHHREVGALLQRLLRSARVCAGLRSGGGLVSSAWEGRVQRSRRLSSCARRCLGGRVVARVCRLLAQDYVRTVKSHARLLRGARAKSARAPHLLIACLHPTPVSQAPANLDRISPTQPCSKLAGSAPGMPCRGAVVPVLMMGCGVVAFLTGRMGARAPGPAFLAPFQGRGAAC